MKKYIPSYHNEADKVVIPHKLILDLVREAGSIGMRDLRDKIMEMTGASYMITTGTVLTMLNTNILSLTKDRLITVSK